MAETQQGAANGERVIRRTHFARIPINRALEVAQMHVNEFDYMTFLQPILEDNQTTVDIAEKTGLEVAVIDGIIATFEEFIMEKHLETLPDGYGHGPKILARYALSS